MTDYIYDVDRDAMEEQIKRRIAEAVAAERSVWETTIRRNFSDATYYDKAMINLLFKCAAAIRARGGEKK